MSAPAKFNGTPDEIRANRASHWFNRDGRCDRCDCRPFGRVADWPCGVEPPRVDEPVDYLTPAFLRWGDMTEGA